MADIDRIDHRLAAVERAVIDGDYEVDELGDLATLTETVERLETRLDEQERRLAALEAKTESLTGFVDNVESVNDDVERQAATAVATVDRLEDRIDELESALEAVRRETTGAEAATGRPKALAGSDPDDTGRQNATSTATEVAFSERETEPDDDGAKLPENAVSEIVGSISSDGDDGGVDDGFEWGAEESAADESAASSPAGEPGAAGMNAAEQESVDRLLADPESDRSESAVGEATTEDAGDEEPVDSGGLLSSVRSKLS
ncbi:hypothetical protein Htur_0339 [Haloterrigena turkmenica DSM 5511]|uniref:DUF7310 domain-containing protein n=1 Tax=Haloterrigena turkmenica (strain ATCC 51198 / DSM 5511 / JCM 9101 / NCIMB 13204 / VKM B-1734 / 4k) TaxID=543526 RepID=D2RUU7_HALTV|nr:hypothetical protein [Haloterrigena turkmenica]ADB59240.1 hypothetical protein Htur_0339 [Haloterrigena turkmenica DSM 5511]